MGAFIAAHKIFFLLLLTISPVVFPSAFHTERAINRRFETWDSEHYLHIAAHGYTPKAGHCAFYPLWPLCIKLGSIMTGGSYLVTGYILANAFSFIGFLLFHRYVREKHDLATADRATVLLVLFPGSIFFGFPYTESLFLLLLMTCLLSLQHGHLKTAAAAAFLLPLTRAIGVFIFPVLLWELLRQKAPLRRYAITAAPLLGYACYFGIMYAFTDNPFEGFTAQQQYPAQPSISRIADPVGFARSFADFRWSHDMLHSCVDRACFVLFMASLFWILRADTTYYVYSIVSGLVPALSNILMSYTRFLLLVFPLFIVWGQFTRRRWIFWSIAAFFLAVQFYFFLRHISGQWVG